MKSVKKARSKSATPAAHATGVAAPAGPADAAKLPQPSEEAGKTQKVEEDSQDKAAPDCVVWLLATFGSSNRPRAAHSHRQPVATGRSLVDAGLCPSRCSSTTSRTSSFHEICLPASNERT